MKAEQLQVLSELRDEGYAVITWTPDEVGTAKTHKVEDRLIELGWDVISDLQEDRS